jgi:hypothetical protein
MRKLCAFGLVLGVAALLVSPALAQPPGGGRGMGGGGLAQYLTNKSVVEEVKIDKDQADKLKEAMDKMREANKDEFAKLRDRDTKPEERAEIMKKMGDETLKIATGILKPEQLKRVQQIAKQQQGVGVFTDAEVQKTLKLTDEQKDDLKKLAEDAGKDMREVFQSAGQGAFGDPEKRAELMKKTAAITAEAMEKATKILKDDQKAALKEVLGEKFDYKPDPPRRPQQRN